MPRTVWTWGSRDCCDSWSGCSYLWYVTCSAVCLQHVLFHVWWYECTGPSKLPELGKGLGKTAKSFQTAAKEFEKELKEEMKDDGDEKESKKPSE